MTAEKDNFADRIIDKDLLERVFLNEKNSTRSMAIMRFIEKVSYEKISEEMGLSVPGIRKRLETMKRRARAIEKVF